MPACSARILAFLLCSGVLCLSIMLSRLVGMQVPEPRPRMAGFPADEGGRSATGAAVASACFRQRGSEVAQDLEAERASEFYPRDPDEWQGMPVSREGHPSCQVRGRCGVALACKAGVCGPCEEDSDCLAGESCAMDHCVRSELAACRTRWDCPEGELCALSGLSAEPRGNVTMRAYCLSEDSGKGSAEVNAEDERDRPEVDPEREREYVSATTAGRLRARVEERLRNRGAE